ncbi:MAG: 50S ribosomal protein L18 [Planctomycetales bacterium]|nr:50S ribosomal protein L18 [Planctomycetales bacterium]
MNHQKYLDRQRRRRRFRVRKAVRGTGDRPRLTVHRTLRHISCQLIDDSKGVTLGSANTIQLKIDGGNCDAAAKVGAAIAEQAKAAGINAVSFDRGHLRYHGRVAALANAVREAGIHV